MPSKPYLFLSVVISLFPSISNSKTIDTFDSALSITSSQTRIQDWDCSVQPISYYNQTYKDHQGKPTSSVVENLMTNLGDNKTFKLTLRRSARTASDALLFNIHERCERFESVPVVTSSVDAQGNLTTTTTLQTTYYNADAEWGCTLPHPSVTNRTQSLECKLKGNPNFEDSSYADQVMSHFQSQNPKLYVKYLGKNENFIFDNCSENQNRRKVITLSQGVDGHIFENDFRFHVRVNNTYLKGRDGNPLEIRSKNGLIDEDISYCVPPEEASNPTTVRINAIEKGWIFDAHYRPTNMAVIDSSNQCDQEVTLKRLNPFGEWWFSTFNRVAVTLEDRSPSYGSRCLSPQSQSNLNQKFNDSNPSSTEIVQENNSNAVSAR